MISDITSMTKFQDNDWEILIENIMSERVVPVIGPELLVAKDNGKEVPFYQYVTKRLVHYFNLTEIEGESIDNLFTRLSIYNIPMKLAKTVMYKILEEMEDMEQAALIKLSSINSFRLFLTTTPDSLLVKAITLATGDPDIYFFSKNYLRHNDLPDKNLQEKQRYVYYLYGRAKSFCDYAISEDDYLIYLTQLMYSFNEPKNLFSYLTDKYLLILGCRYENWLARFFLYSLKRNALFTNKSYTRYLFVDSNTRNDEHLKHFLSRFNGRVYYDGGALEFVNELTKHIHDTPISLLSKNNNDGFINRSIFISYAQEDYTAACKIKRKLESYNLPVWMDERGIISDEDFDKKALEKVKNCTLFLPILSQNTVQTQEPRYYRKEWQIANDIAMSHSPKIPFIHPIAIDTVKPNNEIPDKINSIHWIQAPNGALSKSDVDHLINLIIRMQD